MNLDNLPRLRTMSADQLERNIDRCNAILGQLDYWYSHMYDMSHSPQFRRVMMRRMFYLSERSRRVEIENMLGTFYATGVITQQQYDVTLYALTVGAA